MTRNQQRLRDNVESAALHMAEARRRYHMDGSRTLAEWLDAREKFWAACSAWRRNIELPRKVKP